MRLTLFFVLCFLTIATLKAQSSYVPLGSYSMHVLDRMEIKQGRLATPTEFNTTTRAYKRESIAHYADSFDQLNTPLSQQDKFNLQYLQDDNFEYSSSAQTLSNKPLWGTKIFNHKAAFFDISVPDLTLIFNPVAYFKLEYDGNQKKAAYINTRGLEIRGKFGNHISFYTMLGDEIQQLNTWNLDYFKTNNVVAGQSFLYTDLVKPGDSTIFNYWVASGSISLQAGKYIDMQFGHGRNFLGNGYRSLMLSDFSTDHLFFRVNSRIWKINYTNLFGYMYNYTPFISREFVKRHYYATTHASINITKKFNLGLVQTISFQRDSGHSSTGFDPQYLNPIIFYKPIESSLNSPDKAILGLDFKYNFARHFSLYGQMAISEFNYNERFSGKGWWGNKEAYQLGIKYIDVLNINNLDLQLEYNQASPYMYTSFDAKNAYVNYNQNMAHPTGANFREYIGIVRYQPTNKLSITTHCIYSTFGNDTNGSNWGKDIRMSYNSRINEYGNFIGQGVKTNMLIGELTFTYMIWHNLFIDVQATYRQVTSVLQQFESQTLNGAVALRWNISARPCNY